MRGVTRIVAETLATYELSKNKDWRQTCDDGTSRRTTAMNAFGVSAMKNNAIRPVLLTCSHVGLGEKSEDVIDCIKEVMENGKHVCQSGLKCVKTCILVLFMTHLDLRISVCLIAQTRV